MNRTLDRIVEFDERSRKFPIRAVVAPKLRSYTWRCDTWLDQGQEGACVGFAWAHELRARPVVVPHVDEGTALDIYREAQGLDEWPGNNYEGTSVLAGARVVQKLFIPEYRWAFGLNDLVLAVGHIGPAVLGINWYENMFDTDINGYVHADGDLAGGHAILCNGVNIPGQYFRLHNSWGKGWGVNGEARISFADMEKLLHEEGEACIPTRRIM